MKRKLPALFAALLLTFTLAGCQQAEENPSSSDPPPPRLGNESASTPESSEPSASSEPEKTYTPVLSLDDYPTVDGSTANIPLMALVMERAAGAETAVAESAASASTTAQAWRNLSNGYADLLLVYEAPDSVKEELELGPELEVAAIGRDALVFIVNDRTPSSP